MFSMPNDGIFLLFRLPFKSLNCFASVPSIFGFACRASSAYPASVVVWLFTTLLLSSLSKTDETAFAILPSIALNDSPDTNFVNVVASVNAVSVVPAGPGSPFSPFGPAGPTSPFFPCGPAGPTSPFSPCGPAGPVFPSPVSPLSPFGPLKFPMHIFGISFLLSTNLVKCNKCFLYRPSQIVVDYLHLDSSTTGFHFHLRTVLSFHWLAWSHRFPL